VLAWRYLDVGRFQVTVGDAALVRELQGSRDLTRNRQSFWEGERTARDSFRQRVPFD
jgi:hypothetical protein